MNKTTATLSNDQIAVIIDPTNSYCRKDLRKEIAKVCNTDSVNVAIHEADTESAELVSRIASITKLKKIFYYKIHAGMAAFYSKQIKLKMNGSTPDSNNQYGIALKNHKNNTAVRNFHTVEAVVA